MKSLLLKMKILFVEVNFFYCLNTEFYNVLYRNNWIKYLSEDLNNCQDTLPEDYFWNNVLMIVNFSCCVGSS